jgi:hypothetical protein
MSTQHKISVLAAITVCLTFLTFFSGRVQAQALPGTVKSHQKISDTQGNFTGTLNDDDYFSSSLGDLDGDGVGDLAVGAPADDDGGSGRGAVWVLFMNRATEDFPWVLFYPAILKKK